MVKKFGLVVLILIATFVAVNLINQITGTIKSSERLSELTERVYRLQVQNRELKEKLSDVQSTLFIEEVARNKLGMAKKGEIVVVIPEEKIKEVLGATQAAKIRLPNWLGWWRVFFH